MVLIDERSTAGVEPSTRASSFARVDSISNSESTSSETARKLESRSPDEVNISDSVESYAAQRRREQVYRAQKRHRYRKLEYAHTLEREIEQLQQATSVIDGDIQTLYNQNEILKKVLTSQLFAEQSASARNDSFSSASGIGQSVVQGLILSDADRCRALLLSYSSDEEWSDDELEQQTWAALADRILLED